MNEVSLSDIAREARELREYVASERRFYCAGCKATGKIGEMYEVPENHMLFYAGDLFCWQCAGKCGAR